MKVQLVGHNGRNCLLVRAERRIVLHCESRGNMGVEGYFLSDPGVVLDFVDSNAASRVDLEHSVDQIFSLGCEEIGDNVGARFDLAVEQSIVLLLKGEISS